MRISFGTKLNKLTAINNQNGYGYATNCMLKSLDNLGYHVSPNDSSADVEIWFDQPHHWKFTKGTYKIGYHPWESTQLLPGWADMMNKCDEIWTPSPLIADWYRQEAGIKVPVHVYEHGIEHSWEPRERPVSDQIKFLHIGSEAARKGGWDTVRAFRRAFSGHTGVELTLKMINSPWNGIPKLGRVTYLNKKMEFLELQELFYSHHVYVYPSFGEGFGLTPLQAMATGMPTITLPGWAPYARYMDENLSVGHKMCKSPWPEIHPGKMMRPNFDEVIDIMRYTADNYEKVNEFAMKTAPDIHLAYDWDTITKKVFSDLEERIK